MACVRHVQSWIRVKPDLYWLANPISLARCQLAISRRAKFSNDSSMRDSRSRTSVQMNDFWIDAPTGKKELAEDRKSDWD